MRRFSSLLALAVFTAASLTQAVAQPIVRDHHWVAVGGMNLAAYCKSKHGAEFKAVRLGSKATDWLCERNAQDRRPINAQNVCEQQYSSRPIKADVVGSGGAGDWRCFKPAPPAPPSPRLLGGVDLTAYCQSKYGGEFKAVSLSGKSTDWTCQRNAQDRRPVSVQAACEQQYKMRPVKAVTVGAARATDWRCKG
jgi:hypothetical protein